MKNETTIIAEPGKQEIFVTREFNAPRELVFQAFTEPEMLVKWFGPGAEIRIDFMESKSGGSYRFLHTNPRTGTEFAFFGEFHDVAKPERIIRTFEFSGLPERGHVILETLLFEELPEGRTKTTTQQVFKSVADRDGMVMSGMESGVKASHNQLDEFLERLK